MLSALPTSVVSFKFIFPIIIMKYKDFSMTHYIISHFHLIDDYLYYLKYARIFGTSDQMSSNAIHTYLF